MNILIDLLPTTITVNGIEYKINTDFRTCILFETLMLDNELNTEQKVFTTIDLFFCEEIPDFNSIESAMNELMKFYRCGKEVDYSPKKASPNAPSKKIYDYDFDAPYIYSAFKEQYNIDLQDIEYLHWWKFKALFDSLSDKTMFVKIMGYRNVDLNKITDVAERERIRNIQNDYKIPLPKSEIDKDNEIMNRLLNGKNISDLI